MPALLLPFAATFVAVFAASRLAQIKDRNVTGWMWASALFPPSAVLLAALPKRDVRLSGVRI